MKKLFGLGLLFIVLQIQAQQKVFPKVSNSDRSGAVLVQSDTIICVNSPVGYGNKMEFSASKSDIKSFVKEHNTLWYKILPKKTCEFSFILYPNQVNDDYDFMFLKCDSLCNNHSLLTPLRSNISRNNKAEGSITGLDENSDLIYVGQGPGYAFSKSVKVKAGRVYYLVVDNVYDRGGGHRIVFNYKKCIDTPVETQGPKLILKIENKENHKLLDAKVLIIKKNYPEADDTLLLNRKGQIIISALEENFYYEIIANSDSCLAYREEFKVYPDDSIIDKTIALQKIEPGKKIILDNIYFRGGSADFLRKSYPALKNLLYILKENSNLEIEIQGHVNVPKNTVKKYKENYYQSLSEERAMAVKDYLVKRGIASNRLSYVGFGYSKMKFPYAKTKEEMQQNRRVELLIKKM